MTNNPESGEFSCLHICLFNNGKAIHFRYDLDAPASSFSLLFYVVVQNVTNCAENIHALLRRTGVYCYMQMSVGRSPQTLSG